MDSHVDFLYFILSLFIFSVLYSIFAQWEIKCNYLTADINLLIILFIFTAIILWIPILWISILWFRCILHVFWVFVHVQCMLCYFTGTCLQMKCYMVIFVCELVWGFLFHYQIPEYYALIDWHVTLGCAIVWLTCYKGCAIQ